MILHRPDFRMLCVDPGLRGCGVAEFLGGTLVRAAYVKNPVATGRGYSVHADMGSEIQYQFNVKYDGLVVEMPRVYPGSAQQKGDLNDLLDLAGVGAAIATRYRVWCVTDSVFPSDWKGQVPADMMTERIKRALTQEEKASAEKCAASLAHNLWDAVGIGLHRLGRLNSRKIHNE